MNVKRTKTTAMRTLRVQTTQDHLTVPAMKATLVRGKSVKVMDLCRLGKNFVEGALLKVLREITPSSMATSRFKYNT